MESEEERKRRINRDRVARYRAKNRDKVNAYQRQRRAKDPEGEKKYRQNWWLNRTPEQREKDRIRAREIARRHHFLKKYGITVEQVDAMRAAQGCRCRICRKEEKLHLDHCHATGKVRGLLCAKCNHGLGNFLDDVNLLANAISYLNNDGV